MPDAPSFETPDDCEAAFYAAFEAADVEAMMRVWADDDAIVCVHPLGERLVGRTAVRESWEQIFAGASPVRFDVTDRRFTRDAAISVHSVHENISHGRRLEMRAIVVATNIYRKTREGWRMIVHHASPMGEVEAAETEPADEKPATLH